MVASTLQSSGDSLGRLMSPNLRLFAAISATCFLLDQGSKQWVMTNIAPYGSIEVMSDLFYLTHVRNPGAAFSMFANASDDFRRFFFVGVGGLAIAMIVSFFRSLSPGDRLAAGALGSILGGALGNLFDRVFRGEEFFLGGVVDWLHVRLWTGGSFPDFNFADSFIIIGVALLVFELFTAEGELDAAGSPPSDGDKTVEEDHTPRGSDGAAPA